MFKSPQAQQLNHWITQNAMKLMKELFQDIMLLIDHQDQLISQRGTIFLGIT